MCFLVVTSRTAKNVSGQSSHGLPVREYYVGSNERDPRTDRHGLEAHATGTASYTIFLSNRTVSVAPAVGARAVVAMPETTFVML